MRTTHFSPPPPNAAGTSPHIRSLAPPLRRPTYLYCCCCCCCLLLPARAARSRRRGRRARARCCSLREVLLATLLLLAAAGCWQSARKAPANKAGEAAGAGKGGAPGTGRRELWAVARLQGACFCCSCPGCCRDCCCCCCCCGGGGCCCPGLMRLLPRLRRKHPVGGASCWWVARTCGLGAALAVGRQGVAGRPSRRSQHPLFDATTVEERGPRRQGVLRAEPLERGPPDRARCDGQPASNPSFSFLLGL